MLPLIGRRLLLLIPTLLLVTFGVFSLIAWCRVMRRPRSPAARPRPPSRSRRCARSSGLNDPFLVQYWNWLKDAIRLDFGNSLVTGLSVSDEISNRLPVTLSIALAALVIGVALGIPTGIVAGARQGGWRRPGAARRDQHRPGRSRTSCWRSCSSTSSPSSCGWFDADRLHPAHSPDGLQVTGWLKSLALPAIALGIGMAARLARQVRAGVVDTLGAPYVRTAWAKGCRPMTVVAKHVFKNAAIPTVTVVGLLIGGMIGGTVIIESIFAIPGIGDYMVKSIINKDLPVIQGVAVMFVLAFAIINLVVDLLYGWLNPKVQMT